MHQGLNSATARAAMDRRTSEQRFITELGILRSVNATLEKERDAANEYAQRMVEIQNLLGQITSTRDRERVIEIALTGIRSIIGFERVVFFATAKGGALKPIREIDGSDEISQIPESDLYPSQSSLYEFYENTLSVTIGDPDDLDMPVYDGRGQYCASPARKTDGLFGVFYADDALGGVVSEWQSDMLANVVSQCAIVLENIRLFSKTRQLLQRTQEMALTDALTGLPNRRAILERVNQEIALSRRHQVQFAYAIVDMDNFKRINDELGHAAGDEALKLLAKTMTQSKRGEDVAARIAGDEFVILMPKTDREQAETAISRICDAMHQVKLSCSLGVAIYPEHGVEAEVLFTAADKALYAAKDAGKGQFIFA